MYLDVIDLRNFYASPLGCVVNDALSEKITTHFTNMSNCRIAGIGYATPYLSSMRNNTKCTLAFMPAAQGVMNWPLHEANTATLVDEHMLPLADSVLDRILVIHSLEHAVSPHHMLRELWRVLVPNGRLLIIVPNRRGLWAWAESTPFGYGRPFSRSQLTTLLHESMLSPVRWSQALHMPPFSKNRLKGWGDLCNRFGERLWPTFGGVILVEATKKLYQGLPSESKEHAITARLRPIFAPQITSPNYISKSLRG